MNWKTKAKKVKSSNWKSKAKRKTKFDMTPEELDAITRQKTLQRESSSDFPAAERMAKGLGEVLVDAPLGAVEGVTLGLIPEVAGVGLAATEKLTGDPRTFGEIYRESKKLAETPFKQSSERSPILSPMANIAGGVGPAVALSKVIQKGGLALARSGMPKLARKVGELTYKGSEAISGGIQGAVVSDENRTAGAGMGAGLGLLSELVGNVLGAAFNDPQALEASAMGLRSKDIRKAAADAPVSKQVKIIRDAVDSFREKGLFSGSNLDYNPETGVWTSIDDVATRKSLGPDTSDFSRNLDNARAKLSQRIGETLENLRDDFSYSDLPDRVIESPQVDGYDTQKLSPKPNLKIVKEVRDSGATNTYKTIFKKEDIIKFIKSRYKSSDVDNIVKDFPDAVTLEDLVKNKTTPELGDFLDRNRPKEIDAIDLGKFAKNDFEALVGDAYATDQSKVSQIIEDEMDDLFGVDRDARGERNLTTTINKIQERKNHLYAELESRFSTGNFTQLQADTKKKIAGIYKRILDDLVPELRPYNQKLSEIHKVYDAVAERYKRDFLSDLRPPYGASNTWNRITSSAREGLPLAQIPRASIARELEKPQTIIPFLPPDTTKGEVLRQLPTATGLEMIEEMPQEGRQPQSIMAPQMEMPEVDNTPILRARLPRTTEGVLANKDLFLDKVKLINPQDYEDAYNILNVGDTQEVTQYLKMFSKANPAFFQFDQFGTFDGYVPQEALGKVADSIMNDNSLSYTQRIFKISQLNNTGRMP